MIRNVLKLNCFYNHIYFIFTSYLSALVRGTMRNAPSPVFSTYPAYDTSKSAKIQGFNLLNATDRIAAVEALVQTRHNLICACPNF